MTVEWTPLMSWDMLSTQEILNQIRYEMDSILKNHLITFDERMGPDQKIPPLEFENGFGKFKFENNMWYVQPKMPVEFIVIDVNLNK